MLISTSEMSPLTYPLPSINHNSQLDLFWTNGEGSHGVLAPHLWSQQEGILARCSSRKSTRQAARIADHERSIADLSALNVRYSWSWPGFSNLCGTGLTPDVLSEHYAPYMPQSGRTNARLQALFEEVSEHIALSLSRPCPVYTDQRLVRVEFLDSMAWVVSVEQRAIYLEVRDADGSWQMSRCSFNVLNPLCNTNTYWLDQALLPWISRIEQIFGDRAVDAHWQLRRYLEHQFNHETCLRATTRQISHHINAVPALSGVIRQLRKWSPKPEQNKETYCAFWEEGAVWTNFASFYPQLIHLYYMARNGGLLAAGAGLNGLRAKCMELGLSRAGWRFLSRHGESAYSALVPREGDFEFNPAELLTYIDWQASARMKKPLSDVLGSSLLFYRCIQTDGAGRGTVTVDPRLAKAQQEYRDRMEAVDDENEEYENYEFDWSKVLIWARDHRPEFDRNQWRAGWPAIRKAYENWLRLQPDRLSWDPLIQPFISGEWTIKPLTGSNQLALEGMRMKHCVGGYENRCREGGYQVFSVENARSGRPAATIGLEHAGDGWELDEIRGKFNRNPEPEMKAVARLILEKVTLRTSS